jgi:hypothetical protein
MARLLSPWCGSLLLPAALLKRHVARRAAGLVKSELITAFDARLPADRMTVLDGRDEKRSSQGIADRGPEKEV